jgi:hypothetical protein
MPYLSLGFSEWMLFIVIFYNVHQTHWGGKAYSNKELNAEITVTGYIVTGSPTYI